MFRTTTTNGPTIAVSGKSGKNMTFSTDGSTANPLEAIYFALAGCAAVYAKKACAERGASAEGIEIALRPVGGTALVPKKIETSLRFPNEMTRELRDAVLSSVQECAVKKLMQEGATMEFAVSEV